MLHCGEADDTKPRQQPILPAVDSGSSTEAGGGTGGLTGNSGRDAASDTSTVDSSSGGGSGEGGIAAPFACPAPVAPSASVPVCGNGFRDQPGEECDDGNTSSSVLCSAECRSQDALVGPAFAPDAASVSRHLGAGRHPISAGCNGFAVAYVQKGAADSVSLSVFRAANAPRTLVEGVSNGSILRQDADPVVAGLSGDLYAMAWNDLGGDGDQTGISLRLVDVATGSIRASLFANAGRDFSQYNPDIIRTGSEVVVAWEDDSVIESAPDLRFRRFDRNLSPKTERDETLSAALASETDVALSAFGETWAAAFRSHEPAGESIVVRSGTSEWRVATRGSAPAKDRPSLVELDAAHLLVAFTEKSALGVFTIAGAVLDVAHVGAAQSFEVHAQVTGSAVPRSQPTLTMANESVYLAWHSDAEASDPQAEELWLKEIGWKASEGSFALDLSSAEISLPRSTSHRHGDQRRPALAPVPLWPAGALAAASEDYGAAFGSGEGQPDVAVEFMPLPVFRTAELGSAQE